MIDQKPTPTREQVWAHLLRLWHTNNLPTPTTITVAEYGIFEIKLPGNERAQTDLWAAALDLPASKFAWSGKTGWYAAAGTRSVDSPQIPGWVAQVTCFIDMNADASKHWSGPVVPADADPREQLAAALVEVSA